MQRTAFVMSFQKITGIQYMVITGIIHSNKVSTVFPISIIDKVYNKMNMSILDKYWKLGLLFLIIMMSGNPCLDVLIPYQPTIILLFLGLVTIIFSTKIEIPSKAVIFYLVWIIILLIQGIYTKYYSFSSTFNFLIKTGVGILAILVLKDKFAQYYSKIIYLCCIISLICFTYNVMGGILPFITLSKNIDGGNIYRVSSFIYTQLYNPAEGGGLTLRNCGPFWEPGAFQGFINLALFFEFYKIPRITKKWLLKISIFIVTIITTFSTGGYIVLFVNLMYFLYNTADIRVNTKIILTSLFCLLVLYVFFTTDFLYSKVSLDNSRMVGINDIFSENILYTLFGYGFAENSFNQSSINSASSVFNLIRYTGIVGLCLYFFPFIELQITKQRLYYLIIIFLILMNEPFITAGPFWMCLPLLFPYIKNKY